MTVERPETPEPIDWSRGLGAALAFAVLIVGALGVLYLLCFAIGAGLRAGWGS